MQVEKDRAKEGLVKANALVAETEKKVQDEKDKIHDVEIKNEKYSVDYRSLQKYREDISVLLDSVSCICLICHAQTDLYACVGIDRYLPQCANLK